jgi:hypothetical protein
MFHAAKHMRQLNIGFTFSMMGATVGPGQRQFHYHNNEHWGGFYKLNGLTFHSINPAKQLPWRNWTHMPAQGGLAQPYMHVQAIKVNSMLENHNQLHTTFEHVRETVNALVAGGGQEVEHVELVFRGAAGTQQGAPAAAEMANLGAGPGGARAHGYHTEAVRIRPDGTCHNVKLWAGKPHFEELQYVMLYPKGWGGWYDHKHREYEFNAAGELQRDDNDRPVMLNEERQRYSDLQGKRVSLLDYIKRRILCERHFVKCGMLFQQWVLDMYACDQGRKLWYEQQRQAKRRLLNRGAVGAAVVVAGNDPVPAAALGRPMHSASFTGSPAYYAANKRKALAVLARCGKPSYFITMTCNPHWPEITDALLPGQTWRDRDDLVDRVFKMK